MGDEQRAVARSGDPRGEDADARRPHAVALRRDAARSDDRASDDDPGLPRLTDRGQVERAPNPADGRSYLVKLTPDGRRIVARGRPLVGAVFRRVEPHLTRPAEEYVERSRELRQALAIARDAAAERRSAAA